MTMPTTSTIVLRFWLGPVDPNDAFIGVDGFARPVAGWVPLGDAPLPHRCPGRIIGMRFDPSRCQEVFDGDSHLITHGGDTCGNGWLAL